LHASANYKRCLLAGIACPCVVRVLFIPPHSLHGGSESSREIGGIIDGIQRRNPCAVVNERDDLPSGEAEEPQCCLKPIRWPATREAFVK